MPPSSLRRIVNASEHTKRCYKFVVYGRNILYLRLYCLISKSIVSLPTMVAAQAQDSTLSVRSVSDTDSA